ncbi:MAG: substrate-binding domain-containing protein [Planctomycetaceae bacterium]|nr:substrate-binding domain-containing protein [Planctomycetaceae bacterium]
MKSAPRNIQRILLAGNDRDDVRRGVCDYAQKAGWVVILGEPPKDQPRQTAEFWSVAGIIVRSVNSDNRPWISTRLPVIGLGPHLKGGIMVAPDDGAVGHLAAEHFVQERFTHLAYCYVGDFLWVNQQRAGFEKAARQAGKQFHLLDWPASGTARHGYSSRAFRHWLARELSALPKPLGLLLDSDWTAVDALDACMEAGLAVPEEVALIGVGDCLEICRATPVPLSSVRVDGYRQGYRAAELLDERMSGRHIPRQHVLIPPPGISVRQSSNIIAVPHLPTARALRYVWDHLADSALTSDEVAAAVGLSRRSLDMYFIKHLGRPVAREISEARLTQARILLDTTNKSLARIARETGFSCALHLRRTFNRSQSTPLHMWRKAARATARAS